MYARPKQLISDFKNGAPRVPVGKGGVGGGNKRAAVGVAAAAVVRVLVAVAGGGAT